MIERRVVVVDTDGVDSDTDEFVEGAVSAGEGVVLSGTGNKYADKLVHLSIEPPLFVEGEKFSKRGVLYSVWMVNYCVHAVRFACPTAGGSVSLPITAAA